MSFPVHRANIFPSLFEAGNTGKNDLIASYPAIGYKHKIDATGWYQSAEFTIPVSRQVAERLFETAIGGAVFVYAENPNVAIFEGYIERMTLEYSGVSVTRSLENMQNKVNATFYNASTDATQTTTTFENLDSQAKHGIKQANYKGNINYSSNITSKTALKDTRGSIYSYPQISISNTGGGGGSFRIFLRGFSHYLTWEIYNNASASTGTASNVVQTALITDSGLRPLNSGFIYDTGSGNRLDATQTNASFTFSFEATNQQTHWDFFRQIIESGDGTNQWVGGITPTNPAWGAFAPRRLYYRQANTAVEYTTRGLAETGIIRSAQGGAIVPPQWVRPDRSIRVTDILPFYIGDDTNNDPRDFYIESVEYNAEEQKVTLAGGDNVTLDGAFRFNRYYKKTGVNFGADPLQTL